MTDNNLKPKAKEFIEQNIELIDQNNFTEFYLQLYRAGLSYMGGYLTDLLLKIDVNPCKYMKDVPTDFLWESAQEEYNIPEGIEEIKWSAIGSCAKLTTINFPSTLKSLNKHCVFNCNSVTELKFPDSVEFIADYCVESCQGLTMIYLPKNSKLTRFRKPFVKVNPDCNFKYSGTVAQYKKSIYNYNKTWKQEFSINSKVFCSDGVHSLHD